MKLCPHCKTENAEGSLLCTRCGRSLTDISSSSMPLSASISAPVSSTAPATSQTVPNSPASAASVTRDAFSQPSDADEGTPYRSSGKIGASGIPLMLFSSLIVALLVGGIYGVFSNFINLVIIVPLAAGGLAGYLLSLVVHAGKIRNSIFAGAWGLIVGLLIFGIGEVSHAFLHRAEMVDAFTEYSVQQTLASNVDQNGKPIALPEAEVAKMRQSIHASIDKSLSPVKTVRIYEELTADQGVTVKKSGQSAGFTVAGNAFWVLQALTLLSVAGATAAVAAKATKTPFCEKCAQWQDMTSVLQVHPIQNHLVLEKLDARDWKGLKEIPVGGPLENNRNITSVNVTACPTCGSGTVGVASGRKVPAKYNCINISADSAQALLASSSR